MIECSTTACLGVAPGGAKTEARAAWGAILTGFFAISNRFMPWLGICAFICVQGVLEGMQAKQSTFDAPGAYRNAEHCLDLCGIKTGEFGNAFTGKRIGQDRHAGLADRTAVAGPADIRYPFPVDYEA